jgi:hypothetical protein
MLLLAATAATAGTISSIDPSSLVTRSGEYFVTAFGSGFSDTDQIYYVNSAGTSRYVVDVSSIDSLGNVTGWIPQEVVNSPGGWSVYVVGANGESNAVSLSVLKSGGRLPLQLQLPEILLSEAKSRLGATLRYTVSTTGGDQTTVQIACDPASGSTFPFGRSYVKCSASDGLGNRDSGAFDVTVYDAAPPKLSVPLSFKIAADETDRGAYVKFDAGADDNIDGSLIPTCAPASGDYFPDGKTVVQCEATDSSLNTGYASFEVLVVPRDTGVLQLKLPDDFRVAAQSTDGAAVTFDAIAYGSADPDPVVQCTPASGDWFRMGYNKVYCDATDDFDQRASGGFVVEVYDDGTLKIASVTAEATKPDGAEVTFDTKRDKRVTEVTCSQASGSLFPIGVTTVTCTGVQPNGKERKGSFTVTVEDTIAPHINRVDAVAGALAGNAVPVRVSVEAVDAADSSPRCSITSLGEIQNGVQSQGEVQNGAQGDMPNGGEMPNGGIMPNGGEIPNGSQSLGWRSKSDLEVEIDSAAAARTMRVQVTCTDHAGNRSTGSTDVVVPAASRPRADH